MLIATPQHLHCEHFVASLDAGKHVYQEKTMAFTVEHAKKMRAAWQRAGRRTVADRAPVASSGQVPDAASFLKPELMGKITAIHAHMYRNTPHGKPQWARPVYPDMTAENIVWKSFLGEAPAHDFDANRYINWRYFWDYSGGNVYENMCHQLAFWYKALGLKIPESGHHDRRPLPVERRPRSARHHERLHGTRRGDAVFLGFRFRQRPVEGDRGRARRQRHHLHGASRSAIRRKR